MTRHDDGSLTMTPREVYDLIDRLASLRDDSDDVALVLKDEADDAERYGPSETVDATFREAAANMRRVVDVVDDILMDLPLPVPVGV